MLFSVETALTPWPPAGRVRTGAVRMRIAQGGKQTDCCDESATGANAATYSARAPIAYEVERSKR
jgi:hypothetical protein